MVGAWIFWYRSEAVSQRRSVKKVFLKISQNSQENTFAGASFLIKLQVQVYVSLKMLTLGILTR